MRGGCRELRAAAAEVEVSGGGQGEGEAFRGEVTADSGGDERRFKSLTARLSRADGDGGETWPAFTRGLISPNQAITDRWSRVRDGEKLE